MMRQSRNHGRNQKPRDQQADKDKQCYFCTHGLQDIDFKELKLLQKFVSPYHKIFPRRRTGVCSRHQRKLAVAVKRARFLALIAYVPE